MQEPERHRSLPPPSSAAHGLAGGGLGRRRGGGQRAREAAAAGRRQRSEGAGLLSATSNINRQAVTRLAVYITFKTCMTDVYFIVE
jgi:hypothetical protein